MLRERPKRLPSLPFDQRDPVSDYVYYLFWALHVADVYTTVEGLKWDCVYEANPTLPKVPHLDRLLLHKAVFLQPFVAFQQEDALYEGEMFFPTLLAAYVVQNNIKVINRAEQRCERR